MEEHTNILQLSDAAEAQQRGLEQAGASVGDLQEFDASASISAILKWVGDDADRAQQALDAEAEKDESDQRGSLVKRLEKIVSG